MDVKHEHHQHCEHDKELHAPTALENAGLDDAAAQSLTDALRVSFRILKVIMVLLAVVFAASGIFRVQPDQQAIVLQFGQIRGEGEQRVLGPGLHFAFPEPICEVIRIPVQRVQSLTIETFWYARSEQERLTGKPDMFVPNTLNPQIDGYCLTRNDQQTGLGGSDYNIVHSLWTITYRIHSPIDFFQTVYVRSRQPGEDFLDAAADTLRPLLNSLACDAIVSSLVHYSIDEAVRSVGDISARVAQTLQRRLDELGSGLLIDAVRADRIVWPRQVDEAFLASNRARQESAQAVIDAQTFAVKTLTDAGGPDAEQILAQLKDPAISEARRQELLERLSGQAQSILAEARAYQMRVVEEAKANADYLMRLLPEYQKRPELVLQKIYQDAISEVLAGAEEKIWLSPRQEGQQREVRILLNRDPKAKKGASSPK